MRARDLSKERPEVRIKAESETGERREREIRFSSLLLYTCEAHALSRKYHAGPFTLQNRSWEKTRLFFSLPTALLKTTLTQIIVSKLKLTRHLYGEKLSRERGSPSQPSQLKRAVTGEKKLTHLSHPRADNGARTLTELTRLGELVFLCGEKLAQLREWHCRQIRVTRKNVWPCRQIRVTRESGLPCYQIRVTRESRLPCYQIRVTRESWFTLLPNKGDPGKRLPCYQIRVTRESRFTLLSNKGDPGKRVTLPAELTFVSDVHLYTVRQVF